MIRPHAAPAVLLVVALVAASPGAAVTLVSVRDEIAIGRQADAEIRRRMPRLEDAAVTRYVRTLGTALATRAPGPRYPYSFSVADYRELNAFALPGGPVWINRGVLATATSDAQVAGVLAHEISHVAERHAAQQLTKAVLANGLLGLLGALLGNDSGARAAQMAAALFTNGLFLKFTRDDERAADRAAVRLMARSGWDPRGLIGFLEIARRVQGRDPGAVEVFLSTHPSPADRIADLRADVAGVGRGTRTGTGGLAGVQSRLRRLPPARSMPAE